MLIRTNNISYFQCFFPMPVSDDYVNFSDQVAYDDFVAAGSLAAAREKGLVRF